jgi:hypothetical protein
MFIAGGNNVRVTGLRLQGEGLQQDQGYETGEEAESSYLVGIYVNNKSGFVADNNEIYGWSWSGISLRYTPDAYIHNNYIHHNQARGEGYGTNLYGGWALFEANLYDYNRHDVTGSGLMGEGYEARYNHLLGHGNAIGAVNFDAHKCEAGEHDPYGADACSYNSGGLAGTYYYIHHNTVDGGVIAFAHIRQKPITGIYINNNLIGSTGSDTGTSGNVPIYQTFYAADGYSSLQNVFATNNKWITTVYPTNSGLTWLQVI